MLIYNYDEIDLGRVLADKGIRYSPAVWPSGGIGSDGTAYEINRYDTRVVEVSETDWPAAKALLDATGRAYDYLCDLCC